MKTILFFLLFGFIGLGLHGPETRDINVILTYNLKNTDSTQAIRILSYIPSSINNRQEVFSLYFSTQPDTIYEKDGYKYAEFTLFPPFPSNINIVANMTLYNSCFKTLSKSKVEVDIDDTDLSKYLKSEKFIDSEHPQIRSLAQDLKGKNDIATVKKIYTFVNENIKYFSYQSGPQGSLKTLDTKKGKCCDHSHLMVALCRANSIPAKNVYGLTTNYTNTPRHEWVEIFLNNIGWVAFDPTPGNNANFNTMETRYMYISTTGYNSGMLQKWWHYHYKYKGKKPDVTQHYNIRYIKKVESK